MLSLALLVASACESSVTDKASPAHPATLASPEQTSSAQDGPPDVLAAVEVNMAGAEEPVTPFVMFGPRTVRELRSELEQADVDRRTAPVTVVGRIVNPDGPVANATVQIGDHRTSADPEGHFELADISRRNQIMSIRALGHTSRTVGVVAEREVSVTTVDVGDVTLVPAAPNRHTMIFGGDSSLGRRYIDPDEHALRDALPPASGDALIGLDTARADTAELLSDFAEIIAPYDLVTINLETVVTDDPSAPEDTQRYVLFTLPGSVEALADAGVDHVSLGNNHVWDYGEKGVKDTHDALDHAGIAYSGSGADEDEAFTPHIVEMPGFDFDIALHSWVAIENLPEPYFPAATETKGGAAYLTDLNRVRAEVEATEAQDMLTIAIPHVGYEYTEYPGPNDTFVPDRLRVPVEAGADLVVAHHPHIAQGFEMQDGILVAHSLGNLIFDQPRLDTLYGAMLAVAFDDQELAHARVEPVYIKDFKTTLATGEPADQLLRRLSYFSDDDLVLVPDANAAVIMDRDDAALTERTIRVKLEPDENGNAMVDLRDLRAPGESIGRVTGADIGDVSIGRDLMVLGDMEDHDLDDVHEEIPPWNFGSAGFVCGSQARRGAGALCSTRSEENDGASTISFGQRIRVVGDRINQPQKDLTLLVYERGVNRGDVSIDVSYRASQGSRQMGDVQLAALPARSGDYVQHWLDMDMPPDDPQYIESLPLDRPFRMRPQFRSARAIRLTINHDAPETGAGLLALDDLAVVSWEHPVERSDGSYRTPSPMDFVRVSEAEPGQTVDVVFHSYGQ